MIKAEVIQKWFQITLTNDLHSKVFIPVSNKVEQTQTFKAFQSELTIMHKIDPERASTIAITKPYKDGKHWIALERVTSNFLVGFIKNPDGTMTRKVLSFDPERDRRIKLMRESGFSEEEIEKVEGVE